MKKIILSIFICILIACNGNKNAENTSTETTSDSIDILEEEEYEINDIYVNGDVYTSEDGLVTIESGMYEFGGTSPSYWAKWNITDSKGEKHEFIVEYFPRVDAVHSLRKNDGTKYYLVTCFEKASSSHGAHWLEAFKIVGDTIEEVRVIDGGKKIDDDYEFEVDYSIPSWYFATGGAGFAWIHEYDNKTKNLYEPVSDWIILKDRYVVWHFNGSRFVKLGEQPHKDLHKSLSEYNRLISYFTTKDYIVRVDSLDSHELRYASWKRPKTMADKPDLVLTNGKRHTYSVAGDELQPCDDYRFTKDDYQYIVNYCEVYRTDDGMGVHQDYLLVKKGDKVVLKQEEAD